MVALVAISLYAFRSYSIISATENIRTAAEIVRVTLTESMINGTINKRDDQDKGWSVEIALPLADANGMDKPGVKVPPAVGDMWKINMFRLDAPKDKGQAAVAWSAPLVGDFHKLDRFGELVFGDEKGEVPPKGVAAKDDKAGAKGAEKAAGKDEKPGKGAEKAAGKGAEKAAPAKKEAAAK